MTHPAAWQVWLSAIITLAIYSYLWNNNKLYRMLLNVMMGMTLGAGAGMTFKQQLLLNAPQIMDSFRPLVARADGSPLIGASAAPVSLWMSVNNVIFVGTIVCVMVYFPFSFEHTLRPDARDREGGPVALDDQLRGLLRQHRDDPNGGILGEAAVPDDRLVSHRPCVALGHLRVHAGGCGLVVRSPRKAAETEG